MQNTLKNTSMHSDKFNSIVDKILDITKQDDYPDDNVAQEKVVMYSQQIDQLVYTLYELTPEEIAIVEAS